MSFLLQKIDRPKVTLLEVKSRRLLIGRGTNAHLRSENAAVALEHAVIEKREGLGYEISDRGSITGTYVNGRPIERQTLAVDDRVEIGDMLLTVQVATPDRPLFVRVETIRKEAEQEGPGPKEPSAPVFQIGSRMRAPKIDFTSAYGLPHGFLSKRGMTVLLLLLAVIAVALATVAGGRTVYQPGPISVAHATATRPDGTRVIAASDCGSCHVPFGGASNAKCNECHQQLFHQARRAEVGPCIDCHAEHRAVPQLAAVQERECIECHRRLEGEEITAARTITSFEENHPELKVVLDGERLDVDSPAARTADPIALKFDHQCHLSGDCNVRPPTAADPRRVKVDLDCVSCHTFDQETGAAELVRYEQVCAECHPLTFDNRFPPVPHRLTLEAVAGVIANAYAGNEDLLSRSPAEIARIFASRQTRTASTDSLVVRNAQRVMEVRCAQCHVIEPGARRVEPPGGTRSWFRGMRTFDHNVHMTGSLELVCVDCHGSVATSRAASDLALPSIENCVSCHRASETFAGEGLGNCIMCHFYHEATERLGPGWTARAGLARTGTVSGPDGESSATEETERGGGWVFFMAAVWSMLAIGGIIIIGIVVVVGVAAFFAARRERAATRDALADVGADTGGVGRKPVPIPPSKAEEKPPEATSAPTPAEAPDPSAGSEPSQERASSEPEEKPAPRDDRTVAVPLPGRGEGPQVPGGTMMIEWRGSLAVVDGKLSGKRYPISSEGFYIGRDKELSQVVVDDSRISRRHVWIGVEGDDVVAVDQGSTNGTFIDGERIEKTVLSEGDILVLADQVISLKYEP